MAECAQSKSLKADKELAWKKLSTPAKIPHWTEGMSRGEVVMIIAGRSMGKSMMATQALGRALRKLGNV